MTATIKSMVSKKKLRYVGEGYNLDLSYITDRLIAMGFPAEKFESLYRNNLEDVKRFLDEKHGDHYKIYNLCAERERLYDPAKFHGRVVPYPFVDHHPPKFAMIKKFCDDVTNWLAEDQMNVAAVHCKAGKGRTGVMICCFLLHSGFYKTANQVLEHYGKQRTSNDKGVTIPSQRRYIRYYDAALRNQMEYKSVKMYLRSIVLDFVPSFGTTDNYCLQFEVLTPTRENVYTSIWYQVKGKERLTELTVNPPLLISDDVKIEFSYKPLLKPKLVPPKKEFHFWINTFFLDKELSDSNASHCEIGTSSWSKQEVHTDKKQLEKCDEDNEDDAEECLNVVERKSSNDSDPGVACNAAPEGLFGCSNALPERHVSGGSTCPPSRQVSSSEAGCNQSENLATGQIEKNLPACGCAPLLSEEERMMNQFTNLINTGSISDDTLLREQQHQRLAVSFATNVTNKQLSSSSSSANATHASSFITERMRHSSVPQAATSGRNLRVANSPSELATTVAGQVFNSFHSSYNSDFISHQKSSLREQIAIEGKRIALKLTKNQIDKACKHRGKVYHSDFNVTLFLTKPNEQQDLIDYTLTTPAAAGQPRTPLSSQSSGESTSGGRHQPLTNSSSAACVTPRFYESGGKSEGEHSSPDSSSEEDTMHDSTGSHSRSSSGGSGTTAMAKLRGQQQKSLTPTNHVSTGSSISSLPKTESQKSRTSIRNPWSTSNSGSDNHHPHRSLGSTRSDRSEGKYHDNSNSSSRTSPHQIQFNSNINIMLSNKPTTQTTLIQ